MTDFDAIAAGMSQAVPFAGFLGLEITSIAEGEATAVLPERDELKNHVGSQHAGALFTLAENASGAAFVGAFAERMGDVTPLARSAEIAYEKIAHGPITARAELGIAKDEALATLDREGPHRRRRHPRGHRHGRLARPAQPAGPACLSRRDHINHASREAIAVARGSTSTHAHLRRRLSTIVLVTVFFAAIFTVVVYVSERHAHGTQIHSVFDAFLFSTSQLLTASSVVSPTTQLGKVLELFFDIYAITVVATLAGSFGAFFHQRSKEMDRATHDLALAETDVIKEAEALRKRI